MLSFLFSELAAQFHLHHQAGALLLPLWTCHNWNSLIGPGWCPWMISLAHVSHQSPQHITLRFQDDHLTLLLYKCAHNCCYLRYYIMFIPMNLCICCVNWCLVCLDNFCMVSQGPPNLFQLPIIHCEVIGRTPIHLLKHLGTVHAQTQQRASYQMGAYRRRKCHTKGAKMPSLKFWRPDLYPEN